MPRAYPLGLGDADPLDESAGEADTLGEAAGDAEPLGDAEPPGTGDSDGEGAAHCGSGLFCSPSTLKKRWMASVSRVFWNKIRSQTSAANFPFMSSNLVITGPRRPLGSWQTGLAGNVL